MARCVMMRRARSVGWAFAILNVVIAGCSDGAPAGSDVTGAAPVPADGSSGGGDPGIEPDEPAEVYDLALPKAGALPLGNDDVLRISEGADVDVMTAWMVAPDGKLRATFDRGDVDLTRSALWSFASPDGVRFSRPRQLNVSSATLVASPSFAANKLYFVSSSSLRATATIGHWAIGDKESEATKLPRIVGVDSLLSWPKFRSVADGSVVVAFRDGNSVPRFARSADGKTFAPSVAAAGEGERGAMPDVAEMIDGTLAYSFQQESTSEAMISYVVLSRDHGATWSERIRVSENANVHDTSFVLRADGKGLDLYYIHPTTVNAFSLFRRSLGVMGALGPEEQVTTPAVGEPSKPSVVRRKDGRLVVAWAEISERSPESGAPTIQRLVLAELANDAPL
jgi:hypothetical protein